MGVNERGATISLKNVIYKNMGRRELTCLHVNGNEVKERKELVDEREERQVTVIYDCEN